LEVRDADAFGKADVDKVLQCLPSFLDRSFPLCDHTFGVPPANGILFFVVAVLEGNREVDVKYIEVAGKAI